MMRIIIQEVQIDIPIKRITMLRRTNRPNCRNFTSRQKPVLNMKVKNKLLPLIIRRIIRQRLRTVLLEISTNARNEKSSVKCIEKLLQNSVHRIYLTVWDRMLNFPRFKQKSKYVLSNLNRIVEIHQRQYLIKAFLMIDRQKLLTSKSSHKIYALRGIVEKMEYKRKLWLFQGIKCRKTVTLPQKTTCRLIICLLNQMINKKLFRAWAMILSFMYPARSPESQLSHMSQEIARLNKEIVQSNSEKEIIKMKYNQQCLRSKMNQPKDPKEESEARNGVKSVQGRRKSASRFRNASTVDAIKETSDNFTVVSWMNKSIMSFKSGRSSNISGIQTSRQQKQKLNKYRLQANSYKKQLQILQNQLEVTKDINEHMQQQVTNFCRSGQNRDHTQEIKSLRSESKLLKEQRDQLRHKIIKYQKYIANLKYEFKTKIESLHRSIKSNQ